VKGRPPDDPDSSSAAYASAVRWLTARELSTAQVRARLARKGYSDAAIDAATTRLLAAGIVDDRRAAGAVARTEARVRRHGPHRVMGRLIAMDIDREVAKEVVREVFGEDEDDALLDSAIDRRLRGRTGRLTDPVERRKLVAYLVRQGFSASAAANALRRRSKR
jgi:regulatory protein